MSFAARARAHREEGGAFVFPEFEGWVRLKAWKFGLSKKKNPMFTLEFKIVEAGDLKGKIIKDRTVISSAADWQFDRFLAYLEDSGIDLNALNDKDPKFQDIQDALEFLEDKGQKLRVHLVPQEDDPRYYRLKYLEVQRVGEGAGGPVVEDPADPDGDDAPPPPEDDTAPEPEEAPPPTTTRTSAPARTTTAPAAPASRPAATTATRSAPPATSAGKAGGRKPWEKG